MSSQGSGFGFKEIEVGDNLTDPSKVLPLVLTLVVLRYHSSEQYCATLLFAGCDDKVIPFN